MYILLIVAKSLAI